MTGDPIFREKVYKIRDVLKDINKPKGLYSNYVHPRMAKFTQSRGFEENANVVRGLVFLGRNVYFVLQITFPWGH